MAMLVSARVMTAMRQCSLGATRAARWAAAGRPSLAAAPAAAAAARPGQLLVVRAASSMDNNISSQLMDQVGQPQGLRLRCFIRKASSSSTGLTPIHPPLAYATHQCRCVARSRPR